MSEDDKKRIKRMFGSFCREVAALVFVFPILDKIIMGHHIGFGYACGTYALAIVVLFIGMAFGVSGGGEDG